MKLLAMVAFMLVPMVLFSGTLIINTDTSDPAPKAAFQQLIEDFEKEHPDVKVEWNIFDHEGYKTSIRNFLSAKGSAPDLVAWYAGNRMAPYVRAGLFEDVSDLWSQNNLGKTLKSSKATMTMDGKQWGVPYTYYQWGVYYRKDIFKRYGLSVPKTWNELLNVAKTLKSNGVTPFTIGTKYLWTTAGWFDYLNLRQNGYQFHIDLTSGGKIPYTDRRVKKVFSLWDQLVKPGYFIENHSAYSWQEALQFLVKGEAAMYLIGNFAVAPLKEAGLTDDQLGYFQFPIINPNVSIAEDGPMDTLHIAKNARNKEDAKKFLLFLARADVQTKINDILGQLPTNADSQVKNDPFLKQGFEVLSEADAVAQFYDRDAPAEMAQAGMKGFQEYMVKPNRKNSILRRLDRVRKRVYKN